MMLPLQGLKILDISTMLAAPWSSTFLADYGAEVIKVEHPQNGDHARKYGAQKDGKGVLWKSLNRNKKGISLNLKTTEGKRIFLQLVKDTDVLVENFRPGTLDKWGLDWPPQINFITHLWLWPRRTLCTTRWLWDSGRSHEWIHIS